MDLTKFMVIYSLKKEKKKTDPKYGFASDMVRKREAKRSILTHVLIKLSVGEVMAGK